MAKSRLRENHQNLLKEKLASLKREAMDEAPRTVTEENVKDKGDDGKEDEESDKEESVEEESEKESNSDEKMVEDEQKDDNPEEDDTGTEGKKSQEIVYTQEELLEKGYKAYEEGRYSPMLIRFSDVDQEKLVDVEKDLMELENQRESVMFDHLTTGASGSGIDKQTMEASKDMEADEQTFNVPVPLGPKKYLWQDKYRPRKPRFFNRVHTGYEWNKYNQTHYDMDNPPPKIVQGYKFNIFYPDLIDKTETPQYYLEPCVGEKDFTILRFHSGPPYEDIAFKVVNREWEYSHKHGFRSQFHNGVFQLWFHFKRYRYRR